MVILACRRKATLTSSGVVAFRKLHRACGSPDALRVSLVRQRVPQSQLRYPTSMSGQSGASMATIVA